MNEFVKSLGEVVFSALAEAYQAGKSRAEALDAAAAAIRREDVVSDELWSALSRYVVLTKDFEEDGSGGS